MSNLSRWKGGAQAATMVAAATVFAAAPHPADAARTRLDAASHLADAAPAEQAQALPGPAALAAMLGGPLPADIAALERAERSAAEFPAPSAQDLGDPLGAVAPGVSALPSVVSPAPTIAPSWSGIDQPGGSPSDSTGAVGRTRYVEVVNSKVAVYDRSGRSLATAGLGAWWNVGSASVFDPQVIWDADTERFFYAGDAVYGATDNRLAFGWSTSASPGLGTSDWCRYTLKYGAEFPDYPKLGDSADFLMIGVNVFSGNDFRGADLIAIGKPAAGPGCPTYASLKLGIGRNLSVAGARQFTPVPANQTDSGPNGWVVTVPASLPATSLGLFRVSKSTSGNPTIQTAGAKIAVPSFTVPRNAPQSGTRYLLDSSDGRLTQAVSAKDPLRGNALGIWTQHTILGGVGAAVRWYEIDPLNRVLLQSETVAPRGLYAFNGAISPDRVASGTTRAFGSNMVLGFNTSSSVSFPSIAMIAKRGNDTSSAPVVVRTSPGPVIDFTCASGGGVCRWGDYAAATPDPAASTADSVGRVWATNAWTRDGRVTGANGTSWLTWNWGARP